MFYKLIFLPESNQPDAAPSPPRKAQRTRRQFLRMPQKLLEMLGPTGWLYYLGTKWEIIKYLFLITIRKSCAVEGL